MRCVDHTQKIPLSRDSAALALPTLRGFRSSPHEPFLGLSPACCLSIPHPCSCPHRLGPFLVGRAWPVSFALCVSRARWSEASQEGPWHGVISPFWLGL